MALDSWQARQAGQIRQRHLDNIKTLAANAAECAGYVRRDAEKGVAGAFAGTLMDFAQAIAIETATVAAIDEMMKIAAAD